MKSAWKDITPSPYPWEKEALAFLREGLPDHEPYRAWSNFEFIAEDGSINEVDALVLTPKGCFLVEIKSRPGIVEGDTSTWTWHHEGRIVTVDNPLLLANRKAKKLASLLKKQKKAFDKVSPPFIEPLIFLSHPEAKIQLAAYLLDSVFLRDREAERREDGTEIPGRPGILHALRSWTAVNAPRRRIDRPVGKAVAQALVDAGIRPSMASKRVGDYQLEALLSEGPGYQDWSAKHRALEGDVCRVRIYNVEIGASEETRKSIESAAKKEYELLRGVSHEGILKAHHYSKTDRGPTLFFEHDPEAQRLDHYLAELGGKLTVEDKLALLRQLAEIVRYAHERRLVHRALAPPNILVRPPSARSTPGTAPRLQVFNWHTAARTVSASRASAVAGSPSSVTRQVDELVEDASRVYLAPEVVAERAGASPSQDIFSLGAIAYRLFAGQPPASDSYALKEKLQQGGLKLSSAIDGVVDSLHFLVETSTDPLAHDRPESAAEFLRLLEAVEEELTDPHQDVVFDPTVARKNDRLPGGFKVERVLGRGASSVALLVEREQPGSAGKEPARGTVVLKVALDPSHNDRLRAEAEVLSKLRHNLIVGLHGTVPLGDRIALVLDQAGDETLARRLRQDGRLHLELLERFGDDLLQAVDLLEQQGVSHRDIKPENLGITPQGKDKRLRLVLFDFSLARTAAENIEAGTVAYLDPFLSERKPRRWDGYAERWAATVTLYEMATGQLPRWGDGQSDPAVLGVEVTLDHEAFEPALRDRMTEFFAKALSRKIRDRFDNADEMRMAWRRMFADVGEPVTPSDHPQEGDQALGSVLTLPAGISPQTPLVLLGFSTRALNALDRVGASTVADLLRTSLYRLNHLRGVGIKTKREIAELYKLLSERYPEVERSSLEEAAGETGATDAVGFEDLSVDTLVQQLLPARSPKSAESSRRIEKLFLRLEDPPVEEGASPLDAQPGPVRWPSQSDAAREAGVTRARVGQVLAKVRARWLENPAMTALREDIVHLLDAHGQVMTAGELADAVLARRGSAQSAPLSSRWSAALVRAAVECERDRASTRWIVRRPHDGDRLFVARDEIEPAAKGNARTLIDGQALADYADRLGKRADELAAADPLLPPERALEALQEVRPPANAAALPAARLRQLAVAASRSAALSARLEIYPCGMAAERTLRLAAGALAGPPELTVEEIQQRVLGRYPEAEPPTSDPEALAALLSRIGSERTLDRETSTFHAPRSRSFLTIDTETSFIDSSSGKRPPAPQFEESPIEEIEAKQFEKRLRGALESHQFLVLAASPCDAANAERRLAASFPLEVLSLDALLIEAMKEFAIARKVDWQTVLRADAGGPGPEQRGDWEKLLLVVRNALPKVKERIAAAKRPVLLTNPGLLARYDQLDFLAQLHEATGRADGLPGLWVLVPGDVQQRKPTIDGKPVPVFTNAQWRRVPVEWLKRAS